MRLSKDKIELAMARLSATAGDLDKRAERPTGWAKALLHRVNQGEDVIPRTAGLLARALGCDPAELIADEAA